MTAYRIIANLDDHTGYEGQRVYITHCDEDNYYNVEDINGNQWYCGGEEIKQNTFADDLKDLSHRELVQLFADSCVNNFLGREDAYELNEELIKRLEK